MRNSDKLIIKAENAFRASEHRPEIATGSPVLKADQGQSRRFKGAISRPALVEIRNRFRTASARSPFFSCLPAFLIQIEPTTGTSGPWRMKNQGELSQI